MADHGPLLALAGQRHLRLTTFHRDGRPAPTTIWVVREDDHLLAITPATSGKVKRLRHTNRVLLAPCDARGRVSSANADLEAVAVLFTEPDRLRALRALMRARYGARYLLRAALVRVRGRGPQLGLLITR